MKTEFDEHIRELQGRIMDAINHAINDELEGFREEYEESSTVEELRKEHDQECIGIQVQGNTAKFCSCVTFQMRLSVLKLHSNWHDDLRQRVRNLRSPINLPLLVSREDVLFLISENGKWG